MPPSKESMKIAGNFTNYTKTGNRELIEGIPEDKLEIALMQYAADKRFPHYSAMEMRLNELRDHRKSRRDARDRLKDRLIGFGLGILATLICMFIAKALGWN